MIIVPLGVFEHDILRVVGMLAMVAGFAAVDLSHSYMDLDWVSGVPETGNQKLLTQGPFGLVRNPIFAGVALTQIGFFLVLPSVFTLLTLAVGLTILVIQTRIEEQALYRRFGEAFDTYRSAVPRFVPVYNRSAQHPQPIGGDD